MAKKRISARKIRSEVEAAAVYPAATSPKAATAKDINIVLHCDEALELGLALIANAHALSRGTPNHSSKVTIRAVRKAKPNGQYRVTVTYV